MSGTCPFLTAAAVGAWAAALLAPSVLPPELTLEEMARSIKHPGEGSLIECRIDCMLYYGFIQTGEGTTRGCMLAEQAHYRA